MNLSMKQKQSHRYRGDLQLSRRGVGRDELGVCDQQMQTMIHKVDKHGPTEEHRELYSISCDKP